MANTTSLEITAVWGCGDAESTISVSRDQWNAIKSGERHDVASFSVYEGETFAAVWHFMNGEVTIDGEDGRQCVVGLPFSELFVHPEELA